MWTEEEGTGEKREGRTLKRTFVSACFDLLGGHADRRMHVA